MRSLAFAAAWVGLALGVPVAAPVAAQAAAQDGDVYRVLTVQAAPGELLELIELYRDEKTVLASVGEEPSLWMRHSQGDFWDLFLLYPIGSMAEYFDEARMDRVAGARSASGRTGAELQAAIDAATAWREEVFVHGPPRDEVQGAWAAAGFFHVEMFQGLAGKRAELLRERAMENAYLVALGRDPNHIFTRVAGSSTDAFTIGYYEDLKAYANPPEVTPEEEERAAVDAGFQGAAYIGAYLRELILRHHDTLAVRIPG
jgi:hypothetical protein